MKPRHYSQFGLTDGAQPPFLPDPYIRICTKPYDAQIEEYPVYNQDQNGKLVFSLLDMEKYLVSRGVVWSEDPHGWFLLGKDGLYRKTDEIKLNFIFHEHVRSYNCNIDNITEKTFKDVLGRLKGYSNQENLKTEFDLFINQKDTGNENTVLPAEYKDADKMVHIDGGWLNLESLKILPECACIFDIHPYKVGFKPISAEKLTEDPLYGIYERIIPDEATLSYYFYFCGSCLFDKEPNNSILFLIGQGNTGKTALTKPLEAILEGQVGKSGMGEITARFGKAGLVGMRLNITNEIPKGQQDENTLKEIIQGGFLSVEAKYKDPEKKRLTTRFIVTGNHVPEFDYSDTGIIRRISLIMCNEKQEYNNLIYNKMTTPEALNWFFNYCLYIWDGARRDAKNNVDMRSLKMIDDMNSYRVINGFNLFLSEYCGTMDINGDWEKIAEKFAELPQMELYDRYAEILNANRVKPMSQSEFRLKIKTDLGLSPKPRKDQDGHSRKYYLSDRKKKKKRIIPNESMEEIYAQADYFEKNMRRRSTV